MVLTLELSRESKSDLLDIFCIIITHFENIFIFEILSDVY